MSPNRIIFLQKMIIINPTSFDYMYTFWHKTSTSSFSFLFSIFRYTYCITQNSLNLKPFRIQMTKNKLEIINKNVITVTVHAV